MRNPALYCGHKNCMWKLVDRHGNPSPCQSRKHAHVVYPPIQLNARVRVRTEDVGSAFAPVRP